MDGIGEARLARRAEEGQCQSVLSFLGGSLDGTQWRERGRHSWFIGFGRDGWAEYCVELRCTFRLFSFTHISISHFFLARRALVEGRGYRLVCFSWDPGVPFCFSRQARLNCVAVPAYPCIVSHVFFCRCEMLWESLVVALLVSLLSWSVLTTALSFHSTQLSALQM